MKKCSILFWAMIAILGVCSFASCSSDDDDDTDYDVDWYPVELYITVKDMYGNDLLDTLSNSSVAETMTATFQGETYHLRKGYIDETGMPIPYAATTRLYLSTWYGFCLVNHWLVWTNARWDYVKTDDFMIYVGEIDGAQDMDEDIVLTFPGGVTHTIHYHCSDHKRLDCTRYFTLDGKRLDDKERRIEIVL